VPDTSPFNGNTANVRFFQLDAIRSPHASTEEPQHSKLSARQQEILKLIAEDLTNREIGDRIGVSARTVEFHRINIREKLGVKGVAGLVRYAIRTGLVEP
jgi:DNA-binding CsgD family transcriptional regulator